MKKCFKVTAVTAMLLGVSGVANAGLYIDPTTKNDEGAVSAEAFWERSEATYDAKVNGFTFDSRIHRTIVGASVIYGVHEMIDAYGAFGMIDNHSDGNYDNSANLVDGDGTAIVLGAKGEIPVDLDVNLMGFAQLSILDEDYGKGDPFDTGTNVKNTGEGTEFNVGVVASKEIDSLVAYGGVDLNLYSDLSGKVGSTKLDIERQDKFGIRAGARYSIDEYYVRIDMTFLSEASNTVSVGKNF